MSNRKAHWLRRPGRSLRRWRTLTRIERRRTGIEIRRELADAEIPA